MSSIERSIEVNVPVNTAYNQWTQFEEFPRFMEGIEEVRQLDDKRLHWRANIGGKDKEWDAEIVDQVADQRIAWRSTSGAQNDGVVTFQPGGGGSTQVTLRLDYDPEGFLENVGDLFGVVSRRVEGDLERFRAFIESRGGETGAWRGEIHGGQTQGAATSTSGTASAGMASGGGGMSYAGTTGTAQSASYSGTSGTTTGQTGETAIPVVEEELRVGKREVESGGVRVNVEVEETPVQEQVTLREERVNVERRPVERPASQSDFAAVQEGTIDVRERSEEAVVSKEARVVEEVVINKEVEQRTETIQDSVRRTDVDVEQTPGTTTTSGYREVGGTSSSGTSGTGGNL